MVKHAVSALLVGAAAAFGLLLCGADTPKEKQAPDLSKLRVLRLPDKDLPVQFMLPAAKKTAKGPEPIKWAFSSVDEKKKRTMAFLENLRDERQKIIEQADSEDKKVKLTPAGREMLEGQLQQIAAAIGVVGKFFNEARLVVEDSDDKTTAVVLTAVEIKRTFKLEDGVREAKERPLPWRIGQLEQGKTQVVYDKADKRFKNWEGWKIVRQSAGAAKENETPPTYYDAVYVCRRVLKTGKVFMVDIYAHWEKGKDKDQSFDKQVDALLLGLSF